MLALLLLLVAPSDTTLAERATGYWVSPDSVAYAVGEDGAVRLASPDDTPTFAVLGRILDLTDSTATFVEPVWYPEIGVHASLLSLGASIDGDSLRTADGNAARIVVSDDRLVLEPRSADVPPLVYHRREHPTYPDGLIGTWGGLALDGVGGGVDVYLTFRDDGTVHAQVGFTDEVQRFWVLGSRLLLSEGAPDPETGIGQVSSGRLHLDTNRLTLSYGDEKPLYLGRIRKP